MKYTISQLAYLAGLLDGEGCITVIARHTVGRGHSYRCDVAISNSNKSITDWLLLNFGGTVYKRIFTNPKHKNGYNWYITPPNKIPDILQSVIPFLVAKRAQAELMLEFRILLLSSHGIVSEKDTKRRIILVNRFRLLNRKGK